MGHINILPDHITYFLSVFFVVRIHIFVPKNKVQAIATLAPEVTYFYKKSLVKMDREEAHQPKTEEEVHNRIKMMEETFAELSKRDGEASAGNVLPFEIPDKDKLH